MVTSEAFKDFQFVLHSGFRVARPAYGTPTSVTVRHHYSPIHHRRVSSSSFTVSECFTVVLGYILRIAIPASSCLILRFKASMISVTVFIFLSPLVRKLVSGLTFSPRHSERLLRKLHLIGSLFVFSVPANDDFHIHESLVVLLEQRP